MGFFERFSQGNDVFLKGPYDTAGIDMAQAGSDDVLSTGYVSLLKSARRENLES